MTSWYLTARDVATILELESQNVPRGFIARVVYGRTEQALTKKLIAWEAV